jgi:GNAT superfamily N-acetyltransferase
VTTPLTRGPDDPVGDDARLDQNVLDAPVWASCTSAHRDLVERRGAAVRYLPDLSPFAAVAPGTAPDGLADLAALLGPGGRAVVPFLGVDPPTDWTVELDRPGVQMIGTHLDAEPDHEAVRLGPRDAPEMLDLVARTQPGPFLARTVLFGGYLGIRREGALVAMAGERLRPPGFTEISAVCTDAAYRGRGLATRLVRACRCRRRRLRPGARRRPHRRPGRHLLP